jgi:tetrahydromethanopterin S-methyltransferase subunit E
MSYTLVLRFVLAPVINNYIVPKFDWDDSTNIRVLLLAFAVGQIVCFAIYGLIYHMINSADNREKNIKVEGGGGMMAMIQGEKSQKTEYKTRREYDFEQFKSGFPGILLGIGITVFLFFLIHDNYFYRFMYYKNHKPGSIIVQIIFSFISLFQNNLFKV